MMENERRFMEAVGAAVSAGIQSAGKALERKMIFYSVAYLLTITAIHFYTYGLERDDTDGAARSNMSLHTDNKTGCQYLSMVRGGVTPRLNKSGEHVGCR